MSAVNHLLSSSALSITQRTKERKSIFTITHTHHDAVTSSALTSFNPVIALLLLLLLLLW